MSTALRTSLQHLKDAACATYYAALAALWLLDLAFGQPVPGDRKIKKKLADAHRSNSISWGTAGALSGLNTLTMAERCVDSIKKGDTAGAILNGSMTGGSAVMTGMFMKQSMKSLRKHNKVGNELNPPSSGIMNRSSSKRHSSEHP